LRRSRRGCSEAAARRRAGPATGAPPACGTHRRVRERPPAPMVSPSAGRETLFPSRVCRARRTRSTEGPSSGTGNRLDTSSKLRLEDCLLQHDRLVWRAHREHPLRHDCQAHRLLARGRPLHRMYEFLDTRSTRTGTSQPASHHGTCVESSRETIGRVRSSWAGISTCRVDAPVAIAADVDGAIGGPPTSVAGRPSTKRWHRCLRR
jgi:hypothetical protein